jgi:hypothetical protein
MTELAYTCYKLWQLNQTSAIIENVDVSGRRYNSSDKANVLVIELFNLFSLELSPIIIKDQEWIKSFDHVIINNVYEGPIKLLGQCPIESKSQQPVYEFLMSFYNRFRPKTLCYVDNDIDTDRSFLKWCRTMRVKKPPFKAKYFPNLHFSQLLLGSIAKGYNAQDAKEFFTNEWPNLIPTQYKKLYWSFNRHKRWGRVFIFYMLYKEKLLDKGIVSMHLSHFNSRCISLGKQLGIEITREELIELNKLLPLSVDTISMDSETLPSMKNDEALDAPINVCTETHFFENNLFFTEKTLKPILFRQVILPVASFDLYHTLTDLYDFKFSQITYQIDKIKDPAKRLTATINALQHFDNNPNDLEKELLEVKSNWDHNMKILINHLSETQHTITMRIINENC